ncbi:hypothetical protein C798_25215 [Herbaspirillum rubrisubalbicans Os34]|uniref:Transposon Tn7 transposition protein TnsD C-terminal domain-containing protein n=1 Tax=Herbaspirillum rubrisubalbicans Os34 TaxID=1235827 RepID=A0A6M3ZXP0_9BURK|nr:TnsD family Tn7-like transposition protein [Herbaspirillum rubrisubalbicans]QJQ03414.1 hypothetical protein C798_25215 [Herbaspirillum rubrisubalbicans Os34]
MESQLVHGETPNSFFERLSASNGHKSLAWGSKKRFNMRPNIDAMPNNLSEFVELFGTLTGPVDDVITNNTAFNKLCCGLPLEKFQAQRDRLVGVLPGRTRLTGLGTLLGSQRRGHLRCPECEKVRLETLYFTYGHRREAIDLACICPIHGLPYETVGEQKLLFEQHCKSAPNAYQLKMGQEFAIRQEFCLENPAEGSKYHKLGVIETMKVTGWIGETGRIRMKELRESVPKFFDGAFSDARTDLLTQVEDNVENVMRSLVRQDRAIPSEWCVLLTWHAENCECPKRSAKKPILAPRQRKTDPDIEELRTALAEHKSLQRVANSLGITRSHVETLCRRHELPVNWRPKHVDGFMRTEIRKALIQGMRPEAVCRKFAISTSTLYKMLRSWPDILTRRHRNELRHLLRCKRAWLALVSAHPNMTETNLRRLNVAAWTVLNRRDKQWLKINTPSVSKPTARRPRIYPAVLLEAVDDTLRTIAKACAPDGQRPARKSAYSMRKRSGLNEHAFNTLMTGALVGSYQETRKTFIERRINHAKKNEISITEKHWAIAKATGLREATIRNHLQQKNEMGNGK